MWRAVRRAWRLATPGRWFSNASRAHHLVVVDQGRAGRRRRCGRRVGRAVARVGGRGREAPGVGEEVAVGVRGRIGRGRGRLGAPGVGEEVGGRCVGGGRLLQLHRAGLRREGRGLRVGGGLAGGGPLAGFGLGEEQHLRLAGGAADDDLGAALVLGGLRRRVDLGGEHAPGVHAVAGQDAGGELLADFRAAQGTSGGGLGDQEHVHAQLATHEQDLHQRVDRRGRLRISALADLVPVAGQLPHGGVDLFEEDQRPGADGYRVGVDAQFVGDPGSQLAQLPELDELVVYVGDVAAVRDAVDAVRPRVGDPLGVEDEHERAVVEHLAGDAAQGGRLAAAGGGVDQDVRGFGVQVDGDDPAARRRSR